MTIASTSATAAVVELITCPFVIVCDSREQRPFAFEDICADSKHNQPFQGQGR